MRTIVRSTLPRSAVGGDSAGGNLAPSSHRGARRRRPAHRLPAADLPATDMRRAPLACSERPGLPADRDTIGYFHDHYIADARTTSTGAPRPCCTATSASCRPPCWLTAGYDPLRDEGLAYSQALTGRRQPRDATSASSARSTASSRWAR
jgi:acetyl esterase